jgi:bifunctional DNA-binding transcriptional regulator/antitoxin component of YhaV-PrlF toxin-antitoxin module
MPNEIISVDAKGRMLVKSWVRKTLGISPGDRLLLRLAEDSFLVKKVPS